MIVLLAKVISIEPVSCDAPAHGLPLVPVFIIAGLSLLVYFIPAFVAHYRHHRNAMAIGFLNLFLGWTFLGWVISLVWAMTDNCDR